MRESDDWEAVGLVVAWVERETLPRVKEPLR